MSDDILFTGVCDIFPLQEKSAFHFLVLFRPAPAPRLITGAGRPGAQVTDPLSFRTPHALPSTASRPVPAETQPILARTCGSGSHTPESHALFAKFPH